MQLPPGYNDSEERYRVVAETSLSEFAYYVKRVRELTGAGELTELVPHVDA